MAAAESPWRQEARASSSDGGGEGRLGKAPAGAESSVGRSTGEGAGRGAGQGRSVAARTFCFTSLQADLGADEPSAAAADLQAEGAQGAREVPAAASDPQLCSGGRAKGRIRRRRAGGGGGRRGQWPQEPGYLRPRRYWPCSAFSASSRSCSASRLSAGHGARSRGWLAEGGGAAKSREPEPEAGGGEGGGDGGLAARGRRSGSAGGWKHRTERCCPAHPGLALAQGREGEGGRNGASTHHLLSLLSSWGGC